ncbi:MAG: type II toxin-antitoxin system RelE/ParE family toxin [Gemmatimonadetes bacterium]|nr:type II toxin-antitoxin system RelE/ParE family toxin [Gemmatimonadota bacterium]MYB59735.1 type II toxin-antitoxin system RelE/ParE family toxin [Gemmatimonadota bacterium]MYC13180.1 type II toxin-antitoxin system RelE/ParE family toxin [Gemmatimonadota bacterium]MYF74338.1 type II toxin-antitoxin system RelE/ParE family toxin [Gemmatimonadota bacterium]MYK52970.1 type II toxin-antitoxin system RelE/ParE family toxin [Gemmatimonadota bacterium]
MAYAVHMRSSAERERRRLQGHIRQRINRHLLQLESEPRPSGVEKLVGRPNSWRIRVGDYRILYEIDDANQRVIINRIAHRRDVYQR